jgi:hypothetical protein
MHLHRLRGFGTPAGPSKHDGIVVVEVMVKSLNQNWWSDYKRELERVFGQDHIVMRARMYV